MNVKVPGLCLLLLCTATQASRAQDPLAQLARDVSTKVAASGKNRLVIETRFECGGKCGGFDRHMPGLVRAAMKDANSRIEVLTQQELEPLLLEEGFQPIDYYLTAGLRAAASKANALFLSGSIKLKRDRLELEVQLQRVPEFKTFYKKKVALTRPVDEPADVPVCEPSSHVCLASRGITMPTCIHCPNPSFTQEAINSRQVGIILILVTVTARGTPADLKLIKPLGYGLDEKALHSMAKWRFNPALDSSGKPVATRVTIEVNFRQM